ncbi:hypothetical protein BS329_01580 [Amycolatopsis coloradensis]|uniref:Aminotransferase n=1 Tax=Amycolatopsis coloradensis TaxID=76021 RepID=A0A1R0L3P9_9PSEU|nr:glycogen debranching N-terminal domain-containing protein [Amycolatopsis coloradensis]OLZ57389.1 hypothetical protein BS329_01580 [Amycolatopsis coloradensis]
MTEPVLTAGTTFLLTDESGDVPPGRTTGLFAEDTRHLSVWQLRVEGQRLVPLSARRDTESAETVLVPSAARGGTPPFAVFRTQALGKDGLTERLRVRELLGRHQTIEFGYRAEADFADQFELRSDRSYDKPGGRRTAEVTDGTTVFSYRRADFVKVTTLFAGAAATAAPGGLRLRAELAPHAEAVYEIGVSVSGHRPPSTARLRAARRAVHQEFRAGFTLPAIGDRHLREAVHRGVEDLASLLVPVPGVPGARVPGAGAPWFLTLFGRDSLITALAALPYAPGLAVTTLRALAACQGAELRPDRCEEPGKIPHELRSGELSVFGQVPYSRYYGTVDATPLFLVLLGRLQERGLAGTAATELEPAARAALGWMERHGGLDSHGYLVYPTDTPGLIHQCWKDSADSIAFSTGEAATGPIAAAEVQGYAYEALKHTARLAREVWRDAATAERLERAADDLRIRFRTDFWLSEADFPAIALDGRWRRVDRLGSNAGHLLWSGLLDRPQAAAVARRLSAKEFSSGWGLRTVAAGQPGYHPLSYHNGGVWPHDTALAIAGLARYGFTAEAAAMAGDLLAAAARFQYRLPEVMAGFGRDETPEPVPYPHSCSPQAWAAAAPLFVLDVLGGGQD